MQSLDNDQWSMITMVKLQELSSTHGKHWFIYSYSNRDLISRLIQY